MKYIAVLDVGGTISSYSPEITAEFYHQQGYSILSIINEFSSEDEIKYEHLSNKISHELTAEELLNLAQKIQNYADEQSITSIIVSIGTNALEDVAYFVSLVVKTDKTIIFTGAHYPQNHIAFDGKKNLFNAFVIAQSKLTTKLGVVVTFNDTVVSSRWATKSRPGISNSFSSEGEGILGHIVGDRFCQKMQPTDNYFKNNQFSLQIMNSFPRIVIVFAHFGMDLDYIKYIVEDSKVEGIISAGFGKGYQTREVSKLLNQATITRKIPVVRCARSGVALSNRDVSYDGKYEFINASQFSPHKASLLLSVCLAHGLEKHEIQRAFEEN